MTMTRKISLCSVLSILLILSTPAHADTLHEVLSALDTKTMQSAFTLSVTDDQSQPMTYTGDITIHGRQFLLAIWTTEAAYDGETFYMYSDDSEELTLSTPTEEELLQTNPFLYAQALVPVCKIEERALSNKDRTVITLTPNDTSTGIARFTMQVNTTTLLPLSVEIRETSGKTTSLRLNNPTYLTATPSFTISKPNALLNDLR